jgi:hypothetical protein
MNDAAAPVVGAGGPELLLEHCTALTRVEDVRPTAFRRLEGALGDDLARMLVGALAGPHRTRAKLAA